MRPIEIQVLNEPTGLTPIRDEQDKVVGRVRVPPGLRDQSAVLQIFPPADALLRRISTDPIISSVIDVRLFTAGGQPITSFSESVRICLETDPSVDQEVRCPSLSVSFSSSDKKKKKKDACLGYIDEEEDPPKWKCEDKCVDKGAGDELCGKTKHLTNFAILLTGVVGSDKCGGNYGYIFGNYKYDLALVGGIALLVIILALLFVLLSYTPFGTAILYGSSARRNLKDAAL